jgi:transposase-like protein
VAFGVSTEGLREVLGVMEGGREDEASWLTFLRHLKERGLKGVKFIVSDKCLGLVESLGQVFPEAAWQRCAVHFYRNVFAKTPKKSIREVADMLKAIHAQESEAAAREKAAQVVARMEELKLREAAQVVREGIGETFMYYRFPREHWASCEPTTRWSG